MGGGSSRRGAQNGAKSHFSERVKFQCFNLQCVCYICTTTVPYFMNYVLLYLLYRSLINLTCLSQFDFLSASGAQCLKNSEAAELAEFFQSLLHRKISNQAKMLKNQLLQGSLSSAQ